mmetsp:Transcript_4365/g.9713  ORF Transcript_4365/g.9713 Transcript_4365/m.9713 type:complete len:99 (-) Transcript_4365:364-660(-)
MEPSGVEPKNIFASTDYHSTSGNRIAAVFISDAECTDNYNPENGRQAACNVDEALDIYKVDDEVGGESKMDLILPEVDNSDEIHHGETVDVVMPMHHS